MKQCHCGSWAPVVLVVWLGLGGCATLPGPSTGPTPASERLTADELIAGLARRMDRMQSIRSPYRVFYESRHEKGGFRGAILVRRPDRLRLETISLVGAVLVLTANGDQVSVFLPRERLFSRGRSSRENLLRFTSIPLELKELTAALLGLPPVDLNAHWGADENALVRRLPRGGSERIDFNPESGLPIRWTRRFAGRGDELAASFSEFIATSDGFFPAAISLTYPSQRRVWEIHYEDPDVNVEIPSSLFVQHRPRGVREVPIESFGG